MRSLSDPPCPCCCSFGERQRWIFFAKLDPKTVVSFAGVVITFGMWMADRFGWFPSLRKKAMKATGTWRGWSIYRPTHLSAGSAHRDPEHFFKLHIVITQRFYRVTFTETIEEIFDAAGSKLQNVRARSFTGRGMVLNGINLALIFDELEGLTCGTIFLTMDTWGNQLSGAMVVRNVDGKPVIAEVILFRGPQQAHDITTMVASENARGQLQATTEPRTPSFP